MNKSMRDPSLDATKGILIILLVLHHVVDIGVRVSGIENNLLDIMKLLQRPLALCFFMQSFFLISGMCSRFDYDIKDFLGRQFKTLLLPAFVFESCYVAYDSGLGKLPVFWGEWIRTGGGFWFVVSLFSAKIIFYFLLKIRVNPYIMCLFLMLISICGALFERIGLVNVYSCRQTCDLLIFLAMGHYFKDKILECSRSYIPVAIYAICVGFCLFLYGYKLPYVTASYGTSGGTWPMHVILALLGSLAVIKIAHLTKNCEWLIKLGRISLVIYLIQWQALTFFLTPFTAKLTGADTVESLVSVIIITLCVLSIGSVVAFVLNNSPLRIVLGKRVSNANQSC